MFQYCCKASLNNSTLDNSLFKLSHLSVFIFPLRSFCFSASLKLCFYFPPASSIQHLPFYLRNCVSLFHIRLFYFDFCFQISGIALCELHTLPHCTLFTLNKKSGNSVHSYQCKGTCMTGGMCVWFGRVGLNTLPKNEEALALLFI